MKKNVDAYDFDKKKVVISLFSLALLIMLSLLLYSFENKDQNEQVMYVVNYTLSQVDKSKPSGESESITENVTDDYNEEKINELGVSSTVFRLVREIGIILVSILISSLFTMYIVEKKEKNNIYSEAVSDFFDENKCRLDISDLSKADIQFYTDIASKNIPDDLVESIFGKICSPNEKYYYTKYDIDIKCSINNNIIIKNITEKISLRSYNDSYEFNKDKNPFVITEMTCEKLYFKEDNLPIRNNTEVKNFKIAENEDLSKYIKYGSDSQDNRIHRKMGYNKSFRAWLNYNFTINNENDTELIIEYTTRVPLKDKMFILHFPCACKKAKISFSLCGKNARKYRVYGSAFGFIDNAENTHNNNNSREISFEFNNWSFRRDGAAIGIIRKKSENE